MAFHVPRSGIQAMMKKGTRYMDGKEEVVYDSIATIKDLGTTVKTAYGPYGMNKIVQNHIEKLFLTSDAATMIRELDIKHPAAKMVVMAAHQQEEEAGDGTNGVVILCSAILSEAEYLLRMGLSVPEVVSGLKTALSYAQEQLESLTIHSVDLEKLRDVEAVAIAIRASLMSKQYGNEDFLSKLVAKACVASLPKDTIRFNVDDIRVCKILGSTMENSRIIPGMVFKRFVDSEVKNVKNAKIAMFNCPLDNLQTETKGTVLLKSAEELKDFTKGEENMLKNSIEAIQKSGAQVLVCGGKISDLGLDYANQNGLMVVRLTSKWDMRRLAKSIGATVLPRLSPPTPDEMGFCEDVKVEEIGDTRIVSFQRATSRLCTIVLRSGTNNVLDDLERSVDDAVNNFKLLTKDKRLVPGAGAVEVELSKRLSEKAEQCPGMDQYGINCLSKAYESIPRQLADNSGNDPSKAISKLLAAHSALEVTCERGHSNHTYGLDDGKFELPEVGLTPERKMTRAQIEEMVVNMKLAAAQLGSAEMKRAADNFAKSYKKCRPKELIGECIGINVDNGELMDASEAQIYDHILIKDWQVRLAVSTAITILRVNQIIMAKAAGGPKAPSQRGGHWDDDHDDIE